MTRLPASEEWMVRLRLSPSFVLLEGKEGVLRSRGPGPIRGQWHPQLSHPYLTGALSAEDAH